MIPRVLRLATVAFVFTILLVATTSRFELLDLKVATVKARSIELCEITAGVRDKSMVFISGASFEMGTEPSQIAHLQQVFGINRAELFSAEVPRHTVSFDSFLLDKYEVTNAQFKKFLDKNSQWRKGEIPKIYHNGDYLKHWDINNYPSAKANHPVTNVGWYTAVAYCQWAGKRLPTEAEWDYAARGGLIGKAFPWGDEPADKSRVNFGGSGLKTTTPVGSYPPNGYGLFDMAGNVWEFVSDEWGQYPSSPQVNPVAGGSLFLDSTFLSVTSRRVIRGGSWGGAAVNLRIAYRDSHPPEGAKDFVGFRCARSAFSNRSR